VGGLQRIGHHRQVRPVPEQPCQLQHRAAAVEVDCVVGLDKRQCRLGDPPLLAGSQGGLVANSGSSIRPSTLTAPPCTRRMAPRCSSWSRSRRTVAGDT